MMRAIGIGGVLLLLWLYCQPEHVSAGPALPLDVVYHVAMFAVVGAWFARFVGRGLLVFLSLALLASLLEWVQWWRGGYSGVEYVDIASNLIGLLLGWWLIHRSETS